MLVPFGAGRKGLIQQAEMFDGVLTCLEILYQSK